MTIRTKNQVYLAGDVPAYGGSNGGVPLRTSFMLKLDEHDPDSSPVTWTAAKVKAGQSQVSWGTNLGTQEWDTDESKLVFPTTTDLLEWEGALVDVGATDDVVVIFVGKFQDNANAIFSLGDTPANDGIRFQATKTRVNAVVIAQDDIFTNEIPADTIFAGYYRGIGDTNFTGNSGWRLKTNSTEAIKSEDTAEKTYSGAMTMDLSPAGVSENSVLKPAYCTLYSVFFAVYATGDAPSLAAVKEACQWHVDNHTSAAALADATLRVPYHKL